MDSMQAFMIGQANRGKEEMVFDWIKAAKLILDNPAATYRAGLRSDWEYTGGTIWRDGKPVNGGAFLASTWATPEIDIDGDVESCYVMQSEHPDWGSDTFFPKEAREILGLTEADIKGSSDD